MTTSDRLILFSCASGCFLIGIVALLFGAVWPHAFGMQRTTWMGAADGAFFAGVLMLGGVLVDRWRNG